MFESPYSNQTLKTRTTLIGISGAAFAKDVAVTIDPGAEVTYLIINARLLDHGVDLALAVALVYFIAALCLRCYDDKQMSVLRNSSVMWEKEIQYQQAKGQFDPEGYIQTSERAMQASQAVADATSASAKRWQFEFLVAIAIGTTALIKLAAFLVWKPLPAYFLQ